MKRLIVFLLLTNCATPETYNLNVQPGTDEFAVLERCLIGMDQSEKCQKTIGKVLEERK